MNSMNRAGIQKSVDIDSNDLARGYSGEPNEIQKSVDQIGIDAIVGIVRPMGHLNHCDVHGYYATQGKQLNKDGSDPIEVCPLCINVEHDPKAEGTNATDMELYINLKDQMEQATEIL